MSYRTANTATEVSSRPPSTGHTRAELGLSRTRGVYDVGDELSSGKRRGEYPARSACAGEIFGIATRPRLQGM
eukprot:5891135-Pleurochrysis_carterae.AAC.1